MTKRRKGNTLAIVVVLILLFGIIDCSIGQDNLWLIHKDISVDFSSGKGEYKYLLHSLKSWSEGYVSVCDTAGNLMFYCDGETIWDRNHEVMPNGSGLSGNLSSMQGVLAIQSSHNPQKYFLFTLQDVTDDTAQGSLFFSVVDMSLNNGKGVIITKNVHLADNLTEKMIGIPHPCGGTWIIVHERNSNRFISFWFFDGKILEIRNSNLGSVPEQFLFVGQLKYSPETGILASMTISASAKKGKLEFFKFDPSTGYLSEPILFEDELLDAHKGFLSGDFSASGKYFYTSRIFPNREESIREILQLSMDNYDKQMILSSMQIVGTLDKESYIGNGHTITRGPDQRIYICILSEYNSLHMIDKPDMGGKGCSFIPDGLIFPTKVGSRNCVAPLIREREYKLDYLPADTIVCPDDSIVLDLTSLGGTIIWEDSTTTSIRSIETPGVFRATLVDSNNCALEDTIKVSLVDTVTFLDTTICNGQSISINGVEISAEGTYIDSTIIGLCSTGRMINLNIVPSYTSDTLQVALKQGESYTWYDVPISEPGIHSKKFLSREGCDSIKYLNITSLSFEGIFIPNVFTPNGDGLNDLFEVYAPKFSTVRMKIYDRWGGQIYSSEGSILTWDGMINYSPVDEGVYLYRIDLEDINGNRHQKVGSFTILK